MIGREMKLGEMESRVGGGYGRRQETRDRPCGRARGGFEGLWTRVAYNLGGRKRY